MNERARVLGLRDVMDRSDGWGRSQGREVYQRLLRAVEDNPGVLVFKVSMKGVERVDISFASETVVELARRYRGTKGFCLIDLTDPDLIENVDAAAAKKGQPLLMWQGKSARLLGIEPSQGCREAFQFALQRSQARATEFAESKKGITIANASMKFKQLWEQGFLLRQESTADSGGVEYVYNRIG
ncbi:MAG: hypothetical protein K2Y27_10145 [Xanthobacteraceae bacterium]|nr:hypothetical protein [Xanthobacteraceae bacterium]